MLALLVLAVGIANIPGLAVTDLFLIYGTLRATTMFPHRAHAERQATDCGRRHRRRAGIALCWNAGIRRGDLCRQLRIENGWLPECRSSLRHRLYGNCPSEGGCSKHESRKKAKRQQRRLAGSCCSIESTISQAEIDELAAETVKEIEATCGREARSLRLERCKDSIVLKNSVRQRVSPTA